MALDEHLSTQTDDIVIKKEGTFVISESGNCVFCPNKDFPSIDTVIQFQDSEWKPCKYCSLIRSKLFEQIGDQKKKRYLCSYCSKDELEFNDLRDHLISHYKHEPCICSVEGQYKEDINMIMKEESGCSINNSMFDIKDMSINNSTFDIKDMSYINYPEIGASAVQLRYGCQYCIFRTHYKKELDKHIRTHHKNYSKSFKCNCCDYKSETKGCLIQHIMKVHTGEKPYQCHLCDYKTHNKSHLTSHIKTHSREKKPSFACDYCEYKTLTSCALKIHSRIHTGENVFHCAYCELKLSTKYNLKVHLRKHTGEKPFLCTYCDYKAANNSNLVVHMRIHTGEKPFNCHHCRYKTTNITTLKSHIKRIHKLVPNKMDPICR